MFEFTNPAAPRRSPTPTRRRSRTRPGPPATGIILGGDWSTYWHNGYIYESDIKRGVITWQLNLAGDATAAQANEHLKRTNTFAMSNPQTQTVSYAPDAEGADDRGHRRRAGARRSRSGSTFTPTFTCADAVGVDSCVGTVRQTASAVTNSTLGNKMFRVTAIDSAGNITTKEVAYMVNSVDVPGTVAGGTVDTTLALTCPRRRRCSAPFVPGVAREYLATAAATITSTAGDAALTVHDPATTGTGRLVNGTATLTNPLQVFATATQGTAGVGGARGRLSGSDAADHVRGSADQPRHDADVPPEHHGARRPSAAAPTARR